ncbi:hypothetical protein [Conyzicola nivalis]|uniref:hypothetical protein n=1 Tax=Conyzicola nivalis TaxID=1477021 RepID=UPI00166A830F|nr:hypothetical protein [Conyzicola nivalis]
MTLTAAELAALFEGRTLAVDVNSEYILYVSADVRALDSVVVLGAMTGSNAGRPPSAQAGSASIPLREEPRAQATYEQQVLAARIRVKIDKQRRRPRVMTPEWIVQLSKSDIGR